MAHTIVLTKNFSFWGEVDIEKVVKWLLKKKVEIIKVDESRDLCSSDPSNTCGIKIKWPLIVRLLDFVGYKVKKEKVEYSEGAVYKRDQYICQYWHHDVKGRPFKYACPDKELSIDHVIPKSKGGDLKSFKNSVCACTTCNVKIKKNKTPEEAGLKLIRKPTDPVTRKGDMVYIKFRFNPNKLSHRVFKDLFKL